MTWHNRATALSLLAAFPGCASERAAAPDVELAALTTAGPQWVSGTVGGPDGSSICDYLPAGSLVLVRLIDPVNDGSTFAGSHTIVCPDNSYAMLVDPGVYRLRVQLPSTSGIGPLPWRHLDPGDVIVDAADVNRAVQIQEAIPLVGEVSVDGEPLAGIGLGLNYDFPRQVQFGAGTAVSGVDGTWAEQLPQRSPMLVQKDVRYRIAGRPCEDLLGSRLLAGPPVGGFSYPGEADRIDCMLTDAVSVFTHSLTRLWLTPMAGDIGGQSREFLSDPGRGWGVQFPVSPGQPPRRAFGSSQLYQGGLLVGIAPHTVLSGINLSGVAECGSACRDLGLDGELSLESDGSGGKSVTWSYTDALSPERVGLRIVQRSFDGRLPGDYVLFHFTIRNVSRSPVSFHAGMYADWDIDGDLFDDVGATELGGRLMYMGNGDGAGTYAGTLFLGGVPASGNYVTYFNTPLSLLDQVRALSGGLSAPVLAGTGDKVYYHGIGPITLPLRGNVEFWLAVVAGEDKAQLLASVAAAQQDVLLRQAKPGRGAGSFTTVQRFVPRGNADDRGLPKTAWGGAALP